MCVIQGSITLPKITRAPSDLASPTSFFKLTKLYAGSCSLKPVNARMTDTSAEDQD